MLLQEPILRDCSSSKDSFEFVLYDLNVNTRLFGLGNECQILLKHNSRVCAAKTTRSCSMAGRGRGRGKGSVSFDVGSLGFGKSDVVPAAILQPSPLYPVSFFYLLTTSTHVHIQIDTDYFITSQS